MRYLCKFSYDGTNYFGYQKQKNKITIQENIERCFSQVFRKEIVVVASGRTDAGVSAICQVCHFDVDEQINTRRTIGYMNNLLPKDIKILDIILVNDNFNARYDAKKKTYEYFFYIGKETIPVYENFATHVGYNINIDIMKEACQYFVGVHDFSAFCASNTNIVDKIRNIFLCDIVQIDENLFKFIITGNGFLYNMVRIIMGTLISVGIGKIDINNLHNIIEIKDRSKSGKTMPAKGLYLKNVEY